MDEKYRSQEHDDRDRKASDPRDDEREDELARRRTLAQSQPLTSRERQERWPIG